jgi:hypothetical protein
VVGDVLVVGWVLGWVAIGRWVHGVVGQLAAPGRTLEETGTSLHDGLASAGSRLADVPLVGGELRAPFDAAADAASSLVGAGTAIQDGVARTALVAALSVAVWPVLVVLVLWLRARLRFAREAGITQRLATSGADLELFALRALTHRSLAELAAVSPDPAGDWRRQDTRVIRALAGLELARAGVALPALPEVGVA